MDEQSRFLVLRGAYILLTPLYPYSTRAATHVTSASTSFFPLASAPNAYQLILLRKLYYDVDRHLSLLVGSILFLPLRYRLALSD